MFPVVATSGGLERATATVLFTDLVGSTELRSRLGEAAAEEVRRKHDRLLTEAVEANRGRVVKGLGDGIMATFTGASDAVAAGVGIQQAIDRHNRAADAPTLEIRIGLSAGDVTFDEADCFGTPVIEASRLCAAAAGGQILASDIVRWLAGSAGGSFSPVGALDLKGLTDPLPACEVGWEPLVQSLVPLPALLTDVGRIFVAREDELARLEQLWKEAVASERRVVLLAGEPGVGKTRLAAEMARGVHDEGGVVLGGRCDEDLGVPYQPFVEALRYYVAHAAEPALGRYPGELARLVPELAETVPGLPEPLRSDPETERYRLFDALVAWLAAVSAEAPVLLVLDDLQWAAKPTLLLLRHVLRSSDPLRLLVLVTYRDTELARGHPLLELLADLRRASGIERLSLPGLDGPGVAAFMEQAAGHALDEEGTALAQAIWAETEGNPFFVTEVLRHLAETGAIERREGQWVTAASLEDLGIPEGVREVVGRRLSRLSETANRALSVAAVAGQEFEAGVVHAAARLDEDELFIALDEAVAARLVVEVPGSGPRYRFAHALIQVTLYEELSSAHRVGLHRRVAEAIEALHAGVVDDYLPALAHHWARAAAPAAETDKAVAYATRAGDRALALLAPDEAATYYRQALDLIDASQGPPDEIQRLDLLISLGEAQRRAGEFAHRETLLDAARLAQAGGNADALARAALANQRGMWASGVGTVDADRVVVLEAALEAVSKEDSTTRARLLAALGEELIYTGDRERRVRLSDEAAAMARRIGDATTLARVLLHRQPTITAPTTLAERQADSAEIISLAQRIGDPLLESRASLLRFRAAMEAGEVQEAERCLDAAEQLVGELHDPFLRWFAVVNRATALTFAGRIDEADRLVVLAGEIGYATGQPDASLFLAVQKFQIRFEQGRLSEVEENLKETVDRHPELLVSRSILALLACELDRPDDARRSFDVVSAGGFDRVPFDNLWLRTMTDCAAVCSYLSDDRAAASLHEALTPYAHQFMANAWAVTGSVVYYLGLLATTLGHFDEAEARFHAAEAAHARVGAPAWLARTRLEWARMLLAHRHPGDGERALEFLGQALATARELGLGNVERRAVGLLQ
jgi:class 3 adenylate cyclase/tetratricopeptide (TPR) repeat protein